MLPNVSDRANALFAGGRFREAVEVFSDLLAMDPDNTILLCNRSAALLKLKQNGAAVEDASLAISLHPDAIKPRYRLASALLANGDSDGALQALEPALQQQPANDNCLHCAGRSALKFGTLEPASRSSRAARSR